jgi:hypothetical protein
MAQWSAGLTREDHLYECHRLAIALKFLSKPSIGRSRRMSRIVLRESQYTVHGVGRSQWEDLSGDLPEASRRIAAPKEDAAPCADRFTPDMQTLE